MKTYKIVEGEPPSQFFMDSVSQNGVYGPECYCGFCGRTHWAVDDAYAAPEKEPADYEDYYENYTCITEKAAAKLVEQDPEGNVLNYSTDCFDCVEINNINFVLGCPCNGLRLYEDFIWRNKNVIRSYLKIRIDQEFAWAEEQKTINRLKGIS